MGIEDIRKALLGQFTPEAGQRRRQWLNGAVEENINEPLRYFLGPTGMDKKLQSVATIGGAISPGADVAEAYKASGDLMDWKGPLDAGVDAATLAATLGGLLIPGTYSSMKQGVDDIVDAGVKSYNPSVLGSNGANAAAPSLSPAQRQAKDILDMRAQGRASEVTDDMMGAADPQYMWNNTPLPMDEASRMGRAQDRALI